MGVVCIRQILGVPLLLLPLSLTILKRLWRSILLRSTVIDRAELLPVIELLKQCSGEERTTDRAETISKYDKLCRKAEILEARVFGMLRVLVVASLCTSSKRIRTWLFLLVCRTSVLKFWVNFKPQPELDGALEDPKVLDESRVFWLASGPAVGCKGPPAWELRFHDSLTSCCV
eukprot:905679-Amphidinium_carterae.1